MTRRGLQFALTILGSVAFVAGVLSVAVGATLVPGVDKVPASLDSEMRFFAAWYVGAGVLLLRAVPKVESEGLVVRWVGAIFFLAGCGRALSWAVVGKPHRGFVILMIVELLIPAVIVPWQAAVARRASVSG